MIGQNVAAAADATRVVNALLVSPYDEDHRFMERLFGRTTWTLHAARTCREAAAAMRRHPIAVVIAERELEEDWTALLRLAAAKPMPPVVVATYRFSEADAVNRILSMGAYDVLAKPFDETEVSQVIAFAGLQWMRRRNSMEAPAEALTAAAGGDRAFA